MTKENLLPKLADVEDTIDKMSYSIKDICIEYYNKGYNDAVHAPCDEVKE